MNHKNKDRFTIRFKNEIELKELKNTATMLDITVNKLVQSLIQKYIHEFRKGYNPDKK